MDANTERNSVSADQLFGAVSQLIGMGRGLAMTNLGSMDNELVTQIFLNNLYTVWRTEDDVDDVGALRIAKVAMVSLGYNMTYENVPRSGLNKIIYYARVSRAGLFRNPFHPFYLLEGMERAPASYLSLFNDSDYLPNVVSVLDPENSDFVYLIRLQRLNIMVAQ